MTNLIKLEPLRKAESPATPPLLDVRGLTVWVGLRTVCREISVSLHKGEVLRLEIGGDDLVLVTGPNGSGKSSLLNAIAGLAPARIEAGTVNIKGHDVTKWPAHRRCALGLAYMRQRDNVFSDLTVEDNLTIALGVRGPRIFADSFGGRAASMFGKRAEVLSGGERQILAWAMSLLREGDLLLADEPEGGLAGKVELPRDKACLLVSHSMDRLWEKTDSTEWRTYVD
jgi:ABC-type branched-subunit amino acid transport system ATPase component